MSIYRRLKVIYASFIHIYEQQFSFYLIWKFISHSQSLHNYSFYISFVKYTYMCHYDFYSLVDFLEQINIIIIITCVMFNKSYLDVRYFCQ